MRLFTWKRELRVSDEFGVEFIDLWKSFLIKHFHATLIKQEDVDFDMIRLDFEIQSEVISILSEGMSGTSLIGKKWILEQITKKAKEVDQRLISEMLDTTQP